MSSFVCSFEALPLYARFHWFGFLQSWSAVP